MSYDDEGDVSPNWAGTERAECSEDDEYKSKIILGGWGSMSTMVPAIEQRAEEECRKPVNGRRSTELWV